MPRKEISIDGPGGQWLADRSLWERDAAPDNDEQLERLRRNLRLAREQVLTPRQKEVLELYYERGLNTGQIALKLGLNVSTVTRTLARARKNLYEALRFSL